MISGVRQYMSQFTKFGITLMGCVISNTSSVRRARYCEIEVTPSLCSMENRVIGKYDGSAPTNVMSVPCSVVTYGSLRLVRWLSQASICRASIALTECGIA